MNSNNKKENTLSTFDGFPAETVEFLFNLKFRNTISNEKDNLLKYRTVVSEPLKRLYYELIPTVLEISSCFETRPSRCISTPYTDRRFSPTAPLKEYMYIRFKYIGLHENIPGLYFDMGSDYYSYGLRIYKQNIKGMDKIREKISKSAKSFSAVLDKLTDMGFSIIGESYKKDKFPESAACSAKRLYNMKSFYIGKSVEINKNIFSNILANDIKSGFIAVSEILKLI